METEEVFFDRFLCVPLYLVFKSPYPLLCLLCYVSQSGEVSTTSFMVASWRLMTFINSNRQSSWLHPLFGTLASAIYRTSHFSDFLLTSLTFPSQNFSLLADFCSSFYSWTGIYCATFEYFFFLWYIHNYIYMIIYFLPICSLSSLYNASLNTQYIFFTYIKKYESLKCYWRNGILITIAKHIYDLLVSKNLENSCDQIACYIMENILPNIKMVYLLRGKISNFLMFIVVLCYFFHVLIHYICTYIVHVYHN